MWNDFCAVVEDLYKFVLESLYIIDSSKVGLIKTEALLGIHGSDPYHPQTNLLAAHSHSTTPVIVPLPTQNLAKVEIPAVMYVSNNNGAECLRSPQLDYDAVIDTVPLGGAVTVIAYEGRFAKVSRANFVGFISKEDLTPDKNQIWPEFVLGHVYESDDKETIKTRALLQDIFCAGRLFMPLMPGEYVLLRLMSEHRFIKWGDKRPRLVGEWSSLLRGVSNIHIGINPKVDSVMEWKDEEGVGHIAYVESVTGDKAITITAIGLEEIGRYTSTMLSEEVWKEYRPLFIEVA